MESKILYQPWGGLGDNLQYSTLPERYSELGFDFYISAYNVYRNPEIYELVWKCNPYVKGISFENPNIGSCIEYIRHDSNKSIVYNQEICHGFSPINDIPKIYYNLKRENYSNCVLVDISSISVDPVKPNDFNNYLEENFNDKRILIPKFLKDLGNKIDVDFKYYEEVFIDYIFKYIYLINSVDYFLCGFSGQSVIASSINKKNTIVFTPNKYANSDFKFHNIKYIEV